MNRNSAPERHLTTNEIVNRLEYIENTSPLGAPTTVNELRELFAQSERNQRNSDVQERYPTDRRELRTILSIFNDRMHGFGMVFHEQDLNVPEEVPVLGARTRKVPEYTEDNKENFPYVIN